MSEIGAALIAAIAVLAGIFFEKLYIFFMDQAQRKKEFFNNFFPERLNAHKEIMRVIAESNILYIDPEVATIGLVKEILVQARQKLEAAFLNNILFAAPAVKQGLFGFTRFCGEVIKAHEGTETPLEERRMAIRALQMNHDKLVGLVLEYSGIYIIDQEFAKVLKGSEDVVKDERKKSDKHIHGKKKRP
jgi:hypothetical protein